MNVSKPLLTPEELHCLLDWPLPASDTLPSGQPMPFTSSPALAAAPVPAAPQVAKPACAH